MKKGPAKKVLSVRIPASTHKEIASYCKNNNISISDYVSKSFTNIGNDKLFDVDVDVNKDLLQFLTTVGGGSLVGIVTYKALNVALRKKYEDWSDKKIEALSTTSAITVALMVGYGVSKLFQLTDQE